MKLSNEELIKKIISRLHGVIEEDKANEIYASCDIIVKEGAGPTINGDADAILDKLLRNLIKEGSYLVKITLHNLAQENYLNICPLCRELEEKKAKDAKENADDNEEVIVDDKKTDLQVNMLYNCETYKIVLIKLRNGASLNDHAAECPISVLCMSGHGRFKTASTVENLEKGTFIKLDAKVIHNVETDNEVELLVTKYPVTQTA